MRGAVPIRTANRLFVSFLFCCLLPALALSAWAGERPYTIEAMLGMIAPQDMQLSDDGRLLAFAAVDSTLGPDPSLMASRIQMADTALPGSKIVSPAREQCEKPRFSPDGKWLAYLVDGEDVTDMAVLRLGSGQVRRLTHGLADVIDLAWAPDGRALACTMTINGSPREKRPGENEDVEVLGGGIGVSTGLFLLALDGRTKSRPLVTDREVGEFVFSPDGARIAFETTAPNTPVRGRRRVTASGAPHPQDAAQADIALVDVRSRTVKLVAATEASETMPRFSPDGRFLAYVATEAPGFYFSPGRVMVQPTGGGAPRALARTPDARPELLGWSADGKTLFVREASGTGAVLWALPADGGPIRPFSDTPHVVTQASLSRDGSALALVIEDSALPPEVWVTPTARFAPRQLSECNKSFAAYRLPQTEVVRWTAKDGTAIEGLYTHPIQRGQGPPALLVEIHGGPALAASRQCLGSINYYPLAVFAERGYAIFRPNVRGSDGYGPAFRMANRQDWGGADFDDLQSGLDALIAKGLADPNRLGIMGWSYGGYLAAWAIGHTDRFKAASIGAGITDLVSQAGSMDLPDFIPLYFGGEAFERFDALFDRSPLKYAAAIKTPTLFQHGIDDERVPFGQSMELFTALSRLGVPTALAAYPRSGHDVTEPGLVRDLMVRNLDWFTRFISPAAPGGPATLAASRTD